MLLLAVGSLDDEERRYADSLTRQIAEIEGLHADEVKLLAHDEIRAFSRRAHRDPKYSDPGEAARAFIDAHPDLFENAEVRIEQKRVDLAKAEAEQRLVRLRSPKTWGGHELLAFQQNGQHLLVEVYVQEFLTEWYLVNSRLAEVVSALFVATDHGFEKAIVRYVTPTAQQVDAYGNPLPDERLTTLAIFDVDLRDLAKYNRDSADRGPVFVANKFLTRIHPDIRTIWNDQVEKDAAQFRRGAHSEAARARSTPAQAPRETAGKFRMKTSTEPEPNVDLDPTQLADNSFDSIERVNAILGNATFECSVQVGWDEAFNDFVLVDGSFESAPDSQLASIRSSAVLAPEFTTVGAGGEVAAIVYTSGGGTGVFPFLYLFTSLAPAPSCSHAVILGDRVEINSVRFERPGVVVVDLHMQGPNDPMVVIRSQRVLRRYSFASGGVDAKEKVLVYDRPHHRSKADERWRPYRPPAPMRVLSRGRQARRPELDIWQTDGGALVWAALSGHRSALTDLRRGEKPARGERSLARRINNEALALLRSGNAIGAATRLRDAVQADPSDAEIANNLGYALLLAGRTNECLEALVDTLSLAPERSLAWQNLGQALSAAGEPEAAAGAYRLAVEFSSAPTKTRTFLAARAETGDRGAALALNAPGR